MTYLDKEAFTTLFILDKKAVIYRYFYLDKELVIYYSFYLGVCRGAWRYGYWRKRQLY